jgi:hypothetical protein
MLSGVARATGGASGNSTRASDDQEVRVLEMRTTCERCSATLDPGDDARICSYECTFCAPCGTALGLVCPNCGGELVARPRRAT